MTTMLPLGSCSVTGSGNVMGFAIDDGQKGGQHAVMTVDNAKFYRPLGRTEFGRTQKTLSHRPMIDPSSESILFLKRQGVALDRTRFSLGYQFAGQLLMQGIGLTFH